VLELQSALAGVTGIARPVGTRSLAEEKLCRPESEALFPHSPLPMEEEGVGKFPSEE
jgi:hypothetical protein